MVREKLLTLSKSVPSSAVPEPTEIVTGVASSWARAPAVKVAVTLTLSPPFLLITAVGSTLRLTPKQSGRSMSILRSALLWRKSLGRQTRPLPAKLRVVSAVRFSKRPPGRLLRELLGPVDKKGLRGGCRGVSTFREGGCDEQRAPLCDHGSSLAAHCPTAARQGYGSWRYRRRQPSVSPSCPVEGAHRRPLVRSTPLLRKVEQPVPPLPSLGQQRCVSEVIRGPQGRSPDLEYALAHRRRHCPGSPESRWGKRGTQRQSIGRSRGGLTTKIVALVDALGNLVRFLLLPGQSHQSKATRAKGWHP